MNKQNLLKAIELAENPGECKYFSDGKPSCVVGQLFALEGTKEEELKGFNGNSIYYLLNISECTTLSKYQDNYPIRLLERLQDLWDGELDSEEDIDERKARMVELVNNYEG